MVRGALRRGEALLAGLLRCGYCGRKLHVAYSGTKGQVSRYHCRGATLNHGAAGHCISFGALRIDQAVAQEVLHLLQPLGIEAALCAIEAHAVEDDARRRQLELALEQARFEASRARRQYDAVDPDNRLVAAELERRWNERLATVAHLEAELASLGASRTPALTATQRNHLLALGADLERAWHHPAAGPDTRKRILRAVLKEIVVRVAAKQLELKVHWQGGDHTELAMTKNAHGAHRWKTAADIETLIPALARQLPDGAIASLLNRWGKRTAKGHTWTEARVCTFRSDRHIPVYRAGERAQRGELTLAEAATVLGVSEMTVLRMIRDGILPASHVCKGAPWVIRRADVEMSAVRQALAGRPNRPPSSDANQICIDFQ
jgi:excisionase family DNA binding protein